MTPAFFKWVPKDQGKRGRAQVGIEEDPPLTDRQTEAAALGGHLGDEFGEVPGADEGEKKPSFE